MSIWLRYDIELGEQWLRYDIELGEQWLRYDIELNWRGFGCDTTNIELGEHLAVLSFS